MAVPAARGAAPGAPTTTLSVKAAQYRIFNRVQVRGVMAHASVLRRSLGDISDTVQRTEREKKPRALNRHSVIVARDDDLVKWTRFSESFPGFLAAVAIVVENDRQRLLGETLLDDAFIRGQHMFHGGIERRGGTGCLPRQCIPGRVLAIVREHQGRFAGMVACAVAENLPGHRVHQAIFREFALKGELCPIEIPVFVVPLGTDLVQGGIAGGIGDTEAFTLRFPKKSSIAFFLLSCSLSISLSC